LSTGWRYLTATLLAMAVTGTGCVSTDDATSDGVPIAATASTTHADPLWEEGDAWVVGSVPRVTIGTLDGPAEYQLFRVAAAASQSDGDIVVVAAGAREIRLYDRDGAFVRTIGGRGAGPGEFENPSQVVVAARDSIVIWDDAHRRITRFDSAGVLDGIETIDYGLVAEAIDPPLFPSRGALLPGGAVLVQLVEKSGKTPAPGTTRPLSGMVRVRIDRHHIDTLMFFADAERTTVDAPWGRYAVPPPAAKRTVVAVHPTSPRVCLGEQEESEIVCLGPDTVRTLVRWRVEPQALSSRDVTTWRDTTMTSLLQKLNEEQTRQVLEQVPVPTVRPPYSAIVLDRMGNLWVEVGPHNDAPAARIDYLVFDRAGHLLGTVALPPLDVLEIGDEYLMGMAQDAMGVEFLHIYELTKPSGSTGT